MSEANDISRKKVKFDPLKYNTEIFEDEEDVKGLEAGEEEGNDLDLDTIKSSRNKLKGLKEFDSEESDTELFNENDGNDGNGENDNYNISMSHSEFESDADAESDSESLDERQIPLEPFSLKQDREEGSFDSDGFYIRRNDEEADQDRWMSNFTRADIIKAKKAHREKERKEKEILEDKQRKGTKKNPKELFKELIELLEENERDKTIQQIISSLRTTERSGSIGNRAPLNKNRLKKLLKEQQSDQTISQMSEENKTKLNKITEIVDALMDLGIFDVYDMKGEEISRNVFIE